MRNTDALDKFVAPFLVPPGRTIVLAKDHDPDYRPDGASRAEAEAQLEAVMALLTELQATLTAQNIYALLVILQAMDAAGKDSIIKHVMSCLNPQGTQVVSFKAPSAQELDHDYLWRCAKELPERGRIGIFNRSYYEEVLVVRVHPEILAVQQLPPEAKGPDIWRRRFEQINHFERTLVENGIVIVKIFLNVSKAQQKKRFLERINEPEKHWKFSARDVRERARWDDYMAAYEDMINHTSTSWAPWAIVPADTKWFTRLAVAALLSRALMRLDLRYPTLSEAALGELHEAKEWLERESD
jgi:PPK2 family polyphosphate:nucleotide phosphotransferase